MKLRFRLSFLVKVQAFLLVVFISFATIHALFLKKELILSKKESYAYRRFFKNYRKKDLIIAAKASFSKIALPLKLQNIPFGEDDNIVLKTKKVSIRNVTAPYNPSLIKNNEGYLMFFRYDISSKNMFSSYIGCVELDHNFDQTDKEFVKIETFNKNSEDPRIFQVGTNTYLTYTKSNLSYIDNKPTLVSATINLANIDLKNCKTRFITELDVNLGPVEKNWVPFEYINDEGKSEILFQYSLNPHKILHLPTPETNYVSHLTFSRDDIFQNIFWGKNNWGILRGGTPALKIGNDYLAFFHSSFCDKGQIWYVMGAYTFEGHPPFKINSISKHPILFSGIYDSVALNTAIAKHSVIFPSGFIIEKKADKELIHISCGENDSCIKIITLDKKALLERLGKI